MFTNLQCPGILKLLVIRRHKSSLHSPKDRSVIALHSPVGSLQTGLPLGPAEKRAAELAFPVQEDTFSESGLSEKHAELRAFPAIFSGKPQGFSALETIRRREVNSNSEYPFNEWSKIPCVSDLDGFLLGNDGTGETNQARPRDRAVRFLRRFKGEGLAITGRWALWLSRLDSLKTVRRLTDS